MELLDTKEVAALLKMSKRQVDTLCESRTREKQKHPIPVIKINGNRRFLRADVEAWLLKLREAA